MRQGRADAEGPIFLDRERLEEAFQLGPRRGERIIVYAGGQGREGRGGDGLGNGAPAGDPCEQPMTRGLSRFASLSPSSMEYRLDHISLSLSLVGSCPSPFLIEFRFERGE